MPDLSNVDLISFHNGRVAQWITRLPTEQKIPGSNPGALESLLIVQCMIAVYFINIA